MHSVQIDDLEMVKYPKTEKIQCLRCSVLLQKRMKWLRLLTQHKRRNQLIQTKEIKRFLAYLKLLKVSTKRNKIRKLLKLLHSKLLKKLPLKKPLKKLLLKELQMSWPQLKPLVMQKLLPQPKLLQKLLLRKKLQWMIILPSLRALNLPVILLA